MATDSAIGYATATLNNPAPTVTYSDSLIGFVSRSLANPAGTSDSNIGLIAVQVLPPHHPILVMTASGLKSAPVLSYDGTAWR